MIFVTVSVCLCLCVCVRALYSTLANLNDVSLRLFKIATDLNGIKGKNKAVQRLSGGGAEILLDLVFFFMSL